MNLYLIRCRGMQTYTAGQVAHGTAYVAAENPTDAYAKVRAHLEKNDLGFQSEREMQTIELIGSTDTYPDCGVRYYP